MAWSACWAFSMAIAPWSICEWPIGIGSVGASAGLFAAGECVWLAGPALFATFFRAAFFLMAFFFAAGLALPCICMPGMCIWATTGADRLASASALVAINRTL